jgi:membrane protein required for colicin V production
MNGLDITLVVVAAAFVIYGAARGLVRLVLGAFAVGLGTLLGFWYNAPVAAWLDGWLDSEPFRRLAAFAVIVAATLAAFGVLVWCISKTLDAVELRWVDRLLGGLLGLALASVLLAAVLVPLAAFLPERSPLIGESALSPYVLRVSSVVKAVVPSDLRERFDAARGRLIPPPAPAPEAADPNRRDGGRAPSPAGPGPS